MRRAGALLIVALAIPMAGSAPIPSAPRASRGGTVAGQVIMSQQAARRTVDRYAGATDRAVQQVQAVVYLRSTDPIAGGGHARERLAQRDTLFVPGALVVQVGTTVDFPNADPFFHNVFSYSKPKRFDLGRYPRGESKSVRFDQPGVVKVYCEVHRSMRALIVVVEGPYHAVVDDAGRFAIEDVPPGSYELVAVHVDSGTRRMEVTVSAGVTTPVTVVLK